MADPLSLVPYALAAAGGRVDDWECRQLVAAGLTLLTRSASLVRTMERNPAAILLPPGAAFLVALAACDGRPALVLSTSARREENQRTIFRSGANVVFTVSALQAQVPPEMLTVLLDEIPRSARVSSRDIDLGSHFALDLAGDRETAGSHEVMLLTDGMNEASEGAIERWTHRDMLDAIRQHATEHQLSPRAIHHAVDPWHHPPALVAALATLFVGGRVTTTSSAADTP